jgi:glucokinase
VRAAVGVDLGGTKIAGRVVREDGHVLARDERETPRDTEAILQTLVSVIEDLRSAEVAAVGIGAAGMVDFRAGAMPFAPNLPLRDVPIRDRISKDTGLPCVVDNDANAAGWGERRFGAGRGHDEMLLLTVGTGIGGAVITGGRLARGAHGFAGEIGHVIVEPGGPRCGCGNRGCWEQVASGQAVDRMAQEDAARNAGGGIALAAAGEPVTGRHAARAARSGDRSARRIFAEVGRRLGEGIAGLVNILDPEVVVIGGGVADEGDLLLAPAREAFWETVELRRGRPDVPLIPAELGNEAGAIGAAALALEELSEEGRSR